MRIAFFGTKPYDTIWFQKLNEEKYHNEIKFLHPRLTEDTVSLANGFDAVCTFVNDKMDKEVLEKLNDYQIKLLLLRCAGYNNVDVKAAKKLGITILRVPAYSPEAVAEHAITLALTANRRIPRAYSKVRDNDFSLSGLIGVNLHKKIAGVVGTGKIGVAMVHILKGFGMKVLAYDIHENPELKELVTYVSFDELLEHSDLISLHCPLTKETHHMICKKTIEKMKPDVILVNTSRGGLVNTEDLIEGIKHGKFYGVGLDVFEEENGLVFEDHSEDLLEHTTVARLLSFPNVIVTSHQGFLTKEALRAIAETSLENVRAFEMKEPLKNIVE